MLSVIEDHVSCHYCDKGRLKHSGYGLSYPYDKVIEVTGKTMSSNFCEECYEALTKNGFN